MSSKTKSWYDVDNVAEIPSPALLVYPERIEANVRRMIEVAGGVDRLRPHIKTHKMPEVVRIHLALGVTKFKAATIAECEMAAGAGAPDVLLAYQPVGPNVSRFLELIRRFPGTTFSAVVDDPDAVAALDEAAQRAGVSIPVFLDIDCGQHRTGIEPGPQAVELYRRIASCAALRPAGVHPYDGHLSQPDPDDRAARCDSAFHAVEQLVDDIRAAGMPVDTIVVGGTPSFPIHARRTNVECSPGTCVLWDYSYASGLSDLDFLPAALVLTRVISRPVGRICIDLGHKAIASENPHPRVHLLGIDDARFVSHSEEHLVFETAQAANLKVGDVLYGIPWHICPTVALYGEAVVVRDGRAEERWRITARDRQLTV